MYRKQFIDIYLEKNFDIEEAKSEIDFALDVLFHYTYKDFVLGKEIENWQKEKLKKIITQRVATHRPIQQIIGLAAFFKRFFFVDNTTLIPRPETELLVERVLELSRNFQSPKILDIGTGSGCIAVTLAEENPEIIPDATDISLDTLEMARKNAISHGVFNKVRFFKSDLFENVSSKYNIIVSNPPYIPLKDKVNLLSEVKDYDPSVALFTSDDDGVEFYDKISAKAKDYLLENGYLAFEMGLNQKDIVYGILEKNGFSDIKIYKDYNFIDRVIIAKNDIDY